MTTARGVAGVVAAVMLALLVCAGGASAATTHRMGVLGDGAVWEADVPSNWNGTLLLFSHGYGPLTPQDAPDQTTGQDLLAAGYALAGSSYDPKGSMWALDSAVRDQFATLTAVKRSVLPAAPRRVIAVGQSMGGLISALEDERSAGRLAGALTTCGLVGGGVNLENYQLDGTYAINALLAPAVPIQLTGFATAAQAAATGAELQQVAQAAQRTPAGQARLALASALLNVPTWTTTNLLSENTNPLVPAQSGPAAPHDYAGQELEQYDTEYAPGSIALPFIETGRWSIEQAVGGQPSWDAHVDFAALLAHSSYRDEVTALYKRAGLDLRADLATLTRGANVRAQVPALRRLLATSVAYGRLQVPELDIHTIADQLIPVAQEDYYRRTVAAAGKRLLLRQAYVFRQGHCNFTSAEIIAALHALEHRLTSGRWDRVAQPASLQRAAVALGVGAAAYVPFAPPALTGVNGRFDPRTQGVGSGSSGSGSGSPLSPPGLGAPVLRFPLGAAR